MFVTGSRAVEGDYAIGDALFQQKHKLRRNQGELVPASFWPWELVPASFWPCDGFLPSLCYIISEDSLFDFISAQEVNLVKFEYKIILRKCLLSEISIHNYFKEMLWNCYLPSLTLFDQYSCAAHEIFWKHYLVNIIPRAPFTNMNSTYNMIKESQWNVGWHYVSIPKPQWLCCWHLGMDK